MDELVARLRDFGEYGVSPPREIWDDCVTAATVIETLTAERDAALARVAVMEEAVREAEKQFRWYGDLHAAKPDAGKAKRNYDLADAMSKALEASHDA